MSRRAEILAEVTRIPTLPVAAVKIIGMLQSPDTDLVEIGRLISHDPNLTANILKLANSSLFGGRCTIETVSSAMARLGTRRILDLVVGSTVQPIAVKPVRGYDLAPGELWRHSVAVASGTEELAAVLGIRPPDAAFTAGMLIDIGKHVLGTHMEIDGSAIRKEAFEQAVSFELAERHILGIDHAEVGAALLEHWQLPTSLIEVVRWHHEPEHCPPEHEDIVNLVHVSDQICTLSGIGAGNDGSNYKPCESVLEKLSVSPRVAEATLLRIIDRIESLGDLMGAETGSA